MDIMTPLERIETIIVFLTLLSLSVYILFGYYELRSGKPLEQASMVDHIIGFSLLWIAESTAVLLFVVHRYEYDYSDTAVWVYGLGLGVIAVMVAGTAEFMRRRKVAAVPLVPAALAVSAAVWCGVGLDVSPGLLINFSVTLYLAASILCLLLAYKHRNRITRIGFLYSATGAAILIVNNNVLIWNDVPFTLLLDLALSIVLQLGFFLYYCDLLRHSLHDKISGMKQQNDRLLQAEYRISQLAYFDPTTHTFNIHQLYREMPALERQWSEDPRGSVHFLLINLHHFKNFSSLMGYNKGNEALREIAAALQSIRPQGQRLYRLHSDRFILIHKGSREHLMKLLAEMQQMFRDRRFQGMCFRPYIGVTGWEGRGKPLDDLIKELELAAQEANVNGADCAYYSQDMSRNVQDRLEIESDLWQATEHGVWELMYQPKVSFSSGEIIGAEALIRWKRNGIYVPPDVFIPLAEQLGLIGLIGRDVIRKTFAYRKWIEQKTKASFRIAVNLSTYQLMENDFTQFVAETARFYGIHPSGITFEITESALMQNIEKANETIRQLRRLGFSFSLDDFGVGYSSIHYFSRLDFDEVKFDKSFTKELPIDTKNQIILSSVIGMARQLGIGIVVEGVETEEQWGTVHGLDCDYYQGYYFSRPIAGEALAGLLAG